MKKIIIIAGFAMLSGIFSVAFQTSILGSVIFGLLFGTMGACIFGLTLKGCHNV